MSKVKAPALQESNTKRLTDEFPGESNAGGAGTNDTDVRPNSIPVHFAGIKEWHARGPPLRIMTGLAGPLAPEGQAVDTPSEPSQGCVRA